jgi:hypothetical protein
MLFGDVKDFSKLKENQLPVFADHILGAIAGTLDRYGSAINFRNTWGDGLYVVTQGCGNRSRLRARTAKGDFRTATG